jgi:hypothetical protein
VLSGAAGRVDSFAVDLVDGVARSPQTLVFVTSLGEFPLEGVEVEGVELDRVQQRIAGLQTGQGP